MTKLSYDGVRGCANGLIKSYLTQYAEMEGTRHSSLQECIRLYIRSSFIFDIHKCILYMQLNVSNFCTLTIQLYQAHWDINAELDKISVWLKVNKLSINVSKSKCWTFYHPKKIIPRLQLK